MKTENERLLKTRKVKTREVSSRFLSPTSVDTGGIQSPSQVVSPLHAKCTPPSSDSRKHKSVEDSGFIRGLWPSSSHKNSTPSSKNLGTLADHLGNERLNEYIEQKNSLADIRNVLSLGRQRSCLGIARFENVESVKENHRPLFGGSMRYTGKSRFTDNSSSSSFNSCVAIPGRLSVDETTLYRKQWIDNNLEDCCESGDSGSQGASKSIKKPGIEVSSKYMTDGSTKLRRRTSDSNIQHTDNSPKFQKFTLKNPIKKTNSLTGYGSATSQWALSPGRTATSPVSMENKARPMSFSNMKPPNNSLTKAKGVEKLLSFGFDLFKSKKSSPGAIVASDVESVHHLKLLHNRLMQWRFVNARAQTVDGNITNQVQNNLVCAFDSLGNLRNSVQLNRLQLQKEKLEMNLDFLLRSQMKLLKSWGDMEWQHSSAVSKITECLNFVICRVPLSEGAKADPQSTSIALRHASDLSSSIKSMLTDLCSSAEQTGSLLSELAKVVAQEKLLLEEGFELFSTIATLEFLYDNLIYKKAQILFRGVQNMNDLFSNLFKKFTDLRLQVHADDLEVRMESMKETVNLDKFFEEIENIKQDMEAVKKLYNKLQQSNEKSKNIHDAKTIKKIRARMDSDIVQVLKMVKVIKEKLESLEESNQMHLTGTFQDVSQDRLQTEPGHRGLGKKLKDSMDDFQSLRIRITSEYKETVGRMHLTVTGQKLDEDMIENLISSGESETSLQKAIQEQGKGQILDTISEIQERRDAVKEMEGSLIELHQIFLDMAVLVDAQGQQLNDIESQVGEGSEFVRQVWDQRA